VTLAQEFAGWVKEEPDFEVVAPVPLGLVCFRYRPEGRTAEELDALNQELLGRVNAARTVHLTHTRLAGRYVIRLVVGQRETTREHVVGAWELIRACARSL
jgi:aromatic-L-amino-acid/L-tryptophan decarboxylase